MYSSIYFFFFFKQKTAYEMRISDWSSDVCSSSSTHASCASTLPAESTQAKYEGRSHSCRDSSSSAPVGGTRLATGSRAGSTADIVASTNRANADTIRCACGSRRSEEHTSELQSLMRISYAVFCLKKKT